MTHRATCKEQCLKQEEGQFLIALPIPDTPKFIFINHGNKRMNVLKVKLNKAQCQFSAW